MYIVQHFLLLPDLGDPNTEVARYTHVIPDETTDRSRTEPSIAVTQITAKWGDANHSAQKTEKHKPKKGSLVQDEKAPSAYNTFDPPKEMHGPPFRTQQLVAVPTLDAVTLDVKGRELVAIIGETGCGKV